MSVVEAAVGGAPGASSVNVDAVDGLANRYAKALFDYAEERGSLSDVLDQVRALRALIAESAPLRRFLHDPTLDTRDATKAVEAVMTGQGFGDALRRFVGVVAANNRLSHLPEILAGVLAIDARRRGEMVAEVRTAQPLSPTQRTNLQARLAEAGYARVSIVEHVAPELIGGLVVRIGARLFDTSIRGRLSRIQNVMKGAA